MDRSRNDDQGHPQQPNTDLSYKSYVENERRKQSCESMWQNMYSIVSFPQQLYSHYFPYSILGLQNTMSQMNSVPYPGYAMQNFFNQGGFSPYPLQMLQNYQQLPAPDENVDNQNKKWKSETIFLIFLS